MAPLLGKRKRRDKVVDSRNEQGASTQDENAGSLHSLLRQHFETRFEPLEGVESSLIKKEAGEESAPDADSESDWSGCEEEEEEEKERAVEIIHDSTMPSSNAEVPREESTAFMVNATQYLQLLG